MRQESQEPCLSVVILKSVKAMMMSQKSIRSICETINFHKQLSILPRIPLFKSSSQSCRLTMTASTVRDRCQESQRREIHGRGHALGVRKESQETNVAQKVLTERGS